MFQSKAGYIDARPLTVNSSKTSCNARPDHTLGHSLPRLPDSIALRCLLCPQYRPSFCNAAIGRDGPPADIRQHHSIILSARVGANLCSPFSLKAL
jgi:hypothetical protein